MKYRVALEPTSGTIISNALSHAAWNRVVVETTTRLLENWCRSKGSTYAEARYWTWKQSIEALVRVFHQTHYAVPFNWITPMSVKNRRTTSPIDEFAERLKAVVDTQLAGSRQLLSHFKRVVREAKRSAAEVRPDDRLDTQAILSRWLDFNLASYSVVSSKSLALLEDLLTAAETTLLRSTDGKEQPFSASANRRLELQLHGHRGDRVTTGFELENHFDSPLAISFQVSELTCEGAAPLASSHVTFEPAELTIPPNQTSTVHIAVGIGNDFVVGKTYKATIWLLGSHEKTVGLSIAVIRKEKPTTTKKPSARKRKPQPKRGA